MEINQRLSNKEYQFIFSKTPRLCVDLAVSTPTGLVLTERAIKPFQGTWHLPGGRVMYKESIEEAIKKDWFDRIEY